MDLHSAIVYNIESVLLFLGSFLTAALIILFVGDDIRVGPVINYLKKIDFFKQSKKLNLARNLFLVLCKAYREFNKGATLDEFIGIIDDLTGLYNRRAFNYIASDQICSILVMDMTKFKSFNDTLSHVGGDIYLKIIAYALRSAFKDFGVVYRLGGDEFLVIGHPGTTEKELTDIVESIVIKRDGLALSYGAATGMFKKIFIDADLKLYKQKNDMKEDAPVSVPKIIRSDRRGNLLDRRKPNLAISCN